MSLSDDHLPAPADIRNFQSQGYWIAKGLLNPREAELLSLVSRRDHAMAAAATTRSDAQGGQTVLAVRNELEDNIYSAIARSYRVVESMQRLMGEEMYHYHHKLMLKEPRVGGAWEWHQDYGYWYNYGCLYPRMASCYIAIDPARRENGCLQVVPGSHLLGRLDHGKVGGQTGVDPARMRPILDRLPLEYVLMEPGDALFFHSLVLHRSDQNTSEFPRWALIACYNARSNDPYEVIRHNGYRAINILPDAAIEEVGRQQLQSLGVSST